MHKARVAMDIKNRARNNAVGRIAADMGTSADKNIYSSLEKNLQLRVASWIADALATRVGRNSRSGFRRYARSALARFGGNACGGSALPDPLALNRAGFCEASAE